jgi:hypothetical protein
MLMITKRRIRLSFQQHVPQRVRARMLYAFRVFAAIYGHEVVEAEGEVWVYGNEPDPKAALYIPARYQLRERSTSTPTPVRHSFRGEDLYLFYGLDGGSGKPDWLGEIFEWLSCSDEYNLDARDSIGRISEAASIFARHAVPPARPYASLIMAWLECFIRGEQQQEQLPQAPSPVPNVRHIIIPSHDIDYYFAGRRKAAVRILKNAAIAATLHHSRPFFQDSLNLFAAWRKGRQIGDFFPELLLRSKANDFRSSLFVITRQDHRRDANYRLQPLGESLRTMRDSGFEVALHGSYESVVENCDLGSEASELGSEMGERTLGSRQHWLRFDKPEKLFDCIERAGLQYDSSWGWSDNIGFRNGAAFAYPPYNFEREAPYNFLSIPLVVMDCALQRLHGVDRELPQQATEKILQESRRFGWGGISVLWHNPIEPLSVCSEVNQVFWEMVGRKERHGERWIPARDFIRQTISRYQGAGLLMELRCADSCTMNTNGYEPSRALETASHREYLSARVQ